MQTPNYTFEKILGQGGMATVWLAEHKTLKKPVAIKVLNKEFMHNENIRKRFLSEARNMFGMNHPRIIRVTDLIDQDDLVAFVMEYADGETLKEYLEKNGRLPDEEIRQLMTQMLEALSYVHEQGLVHRDIKPSNFIMSGKGFVKLLDFGIAKNTDSNSAEYTQTGTSQNMGTPLYMSPEQVKSTKDVTIQSDIYSLGVMLWQMVMGRKPYDTKTLSNWELQTKVVTEPLPLTGTHWDGVIEMATQKETGSRFKNCSAFINAIGHGNTTAHAAQPSRDDDRTVIEQEQKEAPSQARAAAAFEPVVPVKNPIKSSVPGKSSVSKSKWIRIIVSLLIVTGLGAAGYFYLLSGKKTVYPIPYLKANGKYNFVKPVTMEPVFGGAEFDMVRAFGKEGMAAVMKDERWGFINEKGEQVVATVYFDAYDFADGLARVRTMKLQNADTTSLYADFYGYIDKTGREVVPPRYTGAADFEDGMARVEKDGYYGFINTSGEEVVPLKYKGAGMFSEGYAWVVIQDKNGFIDKKGTLVIPAKYQYAGSFKEGLAAVEVDDKWGYIDVNGKEVIAPKYDFADEFSGGLGMVRSGEKCGFVDKKGTVAIPFKFDDAVGFLDGADLAVVRIGDFETGKYGAIDKNGKEAIPVQFDWMSPFHQGLCAFEKNEVSLFDSTTVSHKFGYLDKNGGVFIAPEYEDAISFGEQLGVLQKNSKLFYVDLKGNLYRDPDVFLIKPSAAVDSTAASK